MKKVLVIALCLFALACSKSTEGIVNSNGNTAESSTASSSAGTTSAGLQSGDAVTFSVVQPAGQKSSYSMKMAFTLDADNPTPGQPPMSMVMDMGMGLDTDVTASNPDGTWTVNNKISNVKMEAKSNGQPVPMPQDSNKLEGMTYEVTYDKSGKVVKASGLGGTQAEQNVKQMLEQMNPADMFPPGPVKVGDTWPVKMDMPMPTGPNQATDAKGTGRLTDVSNGQATLDYDFSIEMSGQVKGTGKGKSTMKYDIQKNRLIYSTTDMDFDVSGQERGQMVKARMKMNMSIDLVNK